MRAIPFVLAAMLFGGAAQAEDQPTSTTSKEIVVEGTRDRNRQVDRFVDALTEAPVGGQLSRFDLAVCPAAVGLSDQQNEVIVQRMRRVAIAAGLKAGQRGCRANALLIVVDDKEEFVAALHRKYPAYFMDRFGHAAKPRFGPGPVAAWHVEAVLDADGVPLARGIVDGQPQDFQVTATTDSSRLLPPTRPHFVSGIVVVEVNALAGLTTTQLADYAAMRIFAKTDPARVSSSAPTILRLLDAPMGASTPVTLTSWDLGFLKALYSSGERQYANRQRGEMQGLLRRELDAARKQAADEGD